MYGEKNTIKRHSVPAQKTSTGQNMSGIFFWLSSVNIFIVLTIFSFNVEMKLNFISLFNQISAG